MKNGLILGSLFGSDNTFCTSEVFYPTRLTAMAGCDVQGRLFTSKIIRAVRNVPAGVRVPKSIKQFSVPRGTFGEICDGQH